MPGPVFRQEMLSIGRRSRYIVIRTFIGVLMLVLVSFTYWATVEAASWGSDNNGELSISAMSGMLSGFYLTFAWGTLLGVIAITPSIAAGAIATERERRTIEYLFTTDLTNREIVLDKLLAKLLTIGQMLLATLPILAIMRLMGGIPGELLLWHFAILASTATLATSIALITSTWSDNSRTAISNAYGGIFLWMISGSMIYLFSEMIRWYTPWFSNNVLDPIAGALLFINPIAALFSFGGMANNSLGIGLDTNRLALHCLAQIAVATLFLTITILSIRWVHIRSSGKVTKPISRASKVKNRKAPFETLPMLWKEMFTANEKPSTGKRFKQIVVGLVFLMIILPLGWQFFLAMVSWGNNQGQQYIEGAAIMNGFLGSFVLLGMTGRAAGLIPHERERETWLSLMATPMTAREIIYAKTWGNLYAYRWALGLLMLFPTLALFFEAEALITILLLALTLAATAYAVTAFAILLSLRMKSSNKATTSALSAMLFLGGGYLIFVGPIVAIAGGGDEAVIAFSACIPFLISFPYLFAFETGSIEGSMVVSYIFGLLGYTAFGAIMTFSSVEAFDGIEGRAPQATLDTYLKEASSPTDGKLASNEVV